MRLDHGNELLLVVAAFALLVIAFAVGLTLAAQVAAVARSVLP